MRRQHEDPVREDEPVAEVRRTGGRRSRRGRAARRGAGIPGSDVFAASTSTARVSTCTAQYMNPSADELGKTPRAISASTDGVPSLRRPRVHLNGEPRDADEHRDRDHAEDGERRRGVASVRPAKRVDAVGDRLDARQRGRAGCECAEDDEERQRAGAARRPDAAPRPAGSPPVAHLVSPTPISMKIDVTNAYVGSANSTPGLLDATQVRHRDQQHDTRVPGSVRARAATATADVSASTPAATDTATVST